MAASNLILFLLLISVLSAQALPEGGECEEEATGHCISKPAALPLKLIAIACILVTSLIGVCLPLVTRSIPSIQPGTNIFAIVKAFASGIILATGFMHVLPDSFNMLRSSCLSVNPWHKFPFTGFFAMLSAIVTLMVDSIATSLYSQQHKSSKQDMHSGLDLGSKPINEIRVNDTEMGVKKDNGMVLHGHSHLHRPKEEAGNQQLLRYRVIAMVLEFGIVVHSIVIGLSMGASNNTCTIKPLIAALCFHQMFEGVGLGGSILQADFNSMKKIVMVFFFSATTPFGILLGLAISNVYRVNSPKSLIVEGLLNASSAGLLIYMALVDLLASDFMGPKLQGSIMLQIKSYVAVLLGCGGMSLLAKWA